jgi:hypothetical protein
MPMRCAGAEEVVGQEAPLPSLRIEHPPGLRIGIGDFKARTAPKNHNACNSRHGS